MGHGKGPIQQEPEIRKNTDTPISSRLVYAPRDDRGEAETQAVWRRRTDTAAMARRPSKQAKCRGLMTTARPRQCPLPPWRTPGEPPVRPNPSFVPQSPLVGIDHCRRGILDLTRCGSAPDHQFGTLNKLVFTSRRSRRQAHSSCGRSTSRPLRESPRSTQPARNRAPSDGRAHRVDCRR